MKKKTKEKAAGAKALGRKSIEVAAHQLRPAPWNPRPEITSESVADLTASISKVGLIQPIVVMKDPVKPPVRGVEFYLIVAGHRRYRACVDAGLCPIPCDLLDIDEGTAKRMTFLENLQRKDADPLLESELVASLIEGGMTQAEIEAETGRGERWVARRANLMKLSKGWRERVKKGERFTTDCLEHVAAYPEEMQERLTEECMWFPGDEPISWSEISYVFRRESRDLRDAAFDTAQCLSCTSNTGCCPDLFDQDGGKNAQLGRCLCEKCWQEKLAAHVQATVARAEKKGVEIVKGRPDSLWAATDRKTKEYTTLYVFKDGAETVAKWFKPPEKPTAEDKEEKKRLRAEEKERRLKAQRIGHAREAVKDALRKQLADGGIEALKAKGSAFDELAARRLEREFEDDSYFEDDFIDDFARKFGLDGVEMDESLAEEYRKMLDEEDDKDAPAAPAIDYKMRQANDDTTTPDPEGDGE